MKNLFSLLVLLNSLAIIQSPASAAPYKIIDLGPMMTPVCKKALGEHAEGLF